MIDLKAWINECRNNLDPECGPECDQITWACMQGFHWSIDNKSGTGTTCFTMDYTILLHQVTEMLVMWSS